MYKECSTMWVYDYLRMQFRIKKMLAEFRRSPKPCHFVNMATTAHNMDPMTSKI